MRRDDGPLRRPIERSNARHMTSGRKSPVWPGRRLSSTELGCALGSSAGAQVMRKKSPGSHPGAGLVLQREIGDDGCHDQRALVGVPLGDHISCERYRTALGRLLPGHLRLRRIVIPATAAGLAPTLLKKKWTFWVSLRIRPGSGRSAARNLLRDDG